ncbi:trypsin-like peptidase domain-containing protein [uncultured Thiohalocapsa sp.]|uniref:trypsin-like peptidase domain-containing protein n=1 Tax=uncultured Thiohalocapsa sp. TaxID=768990 RepID=UPI0025D0B45A|nr:trypsin-like peptidase domain-containing protein [uncultured Thiohalocapsa sp.]
MHQNRTILILALILMLGWGNHVTAEQSPLDLGIAALKRGDHETAAQMFRIEAEAGSAYGQYNLGVMYDNGFGVPQSDAEAVRWYRMAAEQGDATAQLKLGVMYDGGFGVPQDYAEAARWYRMAAEQGDAKAQFNLGVMYADGEGVPRNDAEAVRWFRMAAEQGDAGAQFNLGLMYRTGKGVPRNDAEAVRWYRMAAEQGVAVAQNNLGVMYRTGKGVPRNDAEAVRWYRMAAEQGHAGAQNNLGVMYRNSFGVTKNLVKAYMWTSLAAAQGNETARHNLEIDERQMTRAQIAEAQRLAAAWQPGTSTTAPSAPGAPDEQETPEGLIPVDQIDPSKIRRIPRPDAPDVLNPQQPNVSRATIRNIQAQLAALGYDPGPVDGRMGPRTRDAIKDLQRDANIEPDGIASTTLSALLDAMIAGREAVTAPAAPEGPALAGTGFFVNRQGHLLTNQHVVEDCSSLAVQLPGGQQPAALIAEDDANDLAVLSVDATQAAVAPLRRSNAELGETVLVAGYPLRGLLGDINVTAGEVSATSGVQRDRRYLQISAPVQKGNSGGPLLDASGAVVGVVVAKLNAMTMANATGDLPQNVNFAIKGALARSFLSIHAIPFTTVDARPARVQTAVATEARQHTIPVECWK